MHVAQRDQKSRKLDRNEILERESEGESSGLGIASRHMEQATELLTEYSLLSVSGTEG